MQSALLARLYIAYILLSTSGYVLLYLRLFLCKLLQLQNVSHES
jgi:hypothetical protein